MLFARVLENEDGTYQVLEWPISEKELRARFGHTILGNTINDMNLAGSDYVIVEPSDPADVPSATKTHKVWPDSISKNEEGKWIRNYSLIEITNEDEYNVRLSLKWKSVREKRDKLLAQADWRVMRWLREERLGLAHTEDIVDIDTYMQKLADITINYDDPFLIDFENL